MTSIVPQGKGTVHNDRFVRTQSNLADQLDKAIAETNFPFVKRALFIRKWMIKLCCSSHDIAYPNSSCCCGCWGKTQVCCVDKTSKAVSGLISLVCGVATVGIHTYCCEYRLYVMDRNRVTVLQERERALDRQLTVTSHVASRSHHRRNPGRGLTSGQLHDLQTAVELATTDSSPRASSSLPSSAKTTDSPSTGLSLPPMPKSANPSPRESAPGPQRMQ